MKALVEWKGPGHYGNICSDAKTKGLPLRERKSWLVNAAKSICVNTIPRSEISPGKMGKY